MSGTLASPGVLVSVVDESFYNSAQPGTVPLILVASAANKSASDGSGTAVGTIPANSGIIYNATSQKDLTVLFGNPTFQTDASGNPLHGSELNEYGLYAAYAYLGVSSSVYVARADIDLDALSGSATAPVGAMANGSYWVDTTSTVYGIFQWNSTSSVFTNYTPTVIDDSNSATYLSSGVPVSGYGSVGQYCVVLTDADTNGYFYKNSSANWVQLGSVHETSFTNGNSPTFNSTVWATSWPLVTGVSTTSSLTTSSSFTINGTTVSVTGNSTVTSVATLINTELQATGRVGAKVSNGALQLFADYDAKSNGTTADGNINIGITQSDSTNSNALLAWLGLSIGTYYSPYLFMAPHTQYPDFSSDSATPRPSGSVYIQTTSPNSGANFIVRQWSSSTSAYSVISAPVYSSGASAIYNLDKTSGGTGIALNSLYVESNYQQGNDTYNSSTYYPVLGSFSIQYRAATGATSITSVSSTSTFSSGTITVSVSVPGQTAFTSVYTIAVAAGNSSNLVTAINNAGVPYLSAKYNSNYSVTISHSTGGEIKFTDPNDILGLSGFSVANTANFYYAGANNPNGTTYVASNWAPLSYTSYPYAPSVAPTSGTLWYDTNNNVVDILYNNGTAWVGYQNAFPTTDPNGPQVMVLAPTTQSDGTPLVNGDIWVSTANIDEYGQNIYVYSVSSGWVLQDVTDHTSINGWVFADARWGNGASMTEANDSIGSLLVSNYIDSDAPDADLYPRGTRLWNLRRSGFNVKQYEVGYLTVDGVAYDRWVTASPNNASGVGSFGRLAQRVMVTTAMNAMINASTTFTDTTKYVYNLIACPGYIEALSAMITLNSNRSYTALVVGDSPLRLANSSTALTAWGGNTAGALDNGETGLVSSDEYTAVYYPSGYTTDINGNACVVPASHMILRMIATNDANAYLWFAPAGVNRGVIDNASAVGYVNSSGAFVQASLAQSIRDAMATVQINPIATFSGTGLVAFAQYTRTSLDTALNRINVARLTAYLRTALESLSRPFLFEPNDTTTRNQFTAVVQAFFTELIAQRAIYDYIVVCDTSNNTSTTIDESQLWMDIAFEPTKSVEFIYIPMRLVATGSIAAGTYTLD